MCVVDHTHVAMLLSGTRCGALRLSLVASGAVPGLLCKEPMVFDGTGGEAGARGDSTTSCIGGVCASVASLCGSNVWSCTVS